MSRLLASPIRLRRIATAVVLNAALVAAVAIVVRDQATAADRARASYLLDALAWMLASLGAMAEARSAAILAEARPRATRRRALFLTVGGTLGLLGGCVLLSLGRDALGAAPRAVAAGALVAGLGGGLGGLLTLAWVFGGTYAADRIAEFDEER